LDLCPLEACGADRAAVAIAGRDIFLNWANMASWPGVPLEGDFAAGLDRNVGAVALALLVACDGRSAETVRGDEAVVEVVRLPADGGRDGVLVLERSIPALVFLAVCDDLVNMAVGSRKGRKKEEKGEHLGDCRVNEL